MRATLLLFLLIFLSQQPFLAQEPGFEFVNPPITIVVLGSSTAAGNGASPISNSWVNRFRDYVQGFNPNNQVINLAKGGYNTYLLMPSDFNPPRNRPNPDTLRNFTRALEFHPDGIIVNLPSNDIANGYSVEEQLSNFRRYEEFAASHRVELWITTTQARNFPRNRDRLLQNTLKDSLNTIFPNNCIDFWSGFCNQEYELLKQYDKGDGCHLNNDGHKILTDRVIDSQAFCYQMNNSSLQQSNAISDREELSPHLLEIGFTGDIEFDSTRSDLKRFVKIVQEDRVLNVVEVSKTAYTIETIIDLRYPIEVVFEAPYSLTKVVSFNFEQLLESEHRPSNFYPIEALDIVEFSNDSLNYQFPKNEFSVARFVYDSTYLGVRMDERFFKHQRLRIEDAFIQPPTKGNKSISYWENGNKKAVLKFKKGQLHGKAKWYYENGNRKRFVQFKQGMYNGKYVDYSEDGSRKMKRLFKLDAATGDLFSN